MIYALIYLIVVSFVFWYLCDIRYEDVENPLTGDTVLFLIGLLSLGWPLTMWFIIPYYIVKRIKEE